MTQPSEKLAEILASLRPLYEKIATSNFDPLRLYSTWLKFTFCRAFSFVELASVQKPETAFFLVPALRAITEDLILLRFLTKKGSVDERETVARNLMTIDAANKSTYQIRFFRTFRPFQPVLSTREDSEENVSKAKDELRDFWKSNGWPKFKIRGKKPPMPPIRDLAKKSDPGMLEVVYDFIYRLASGEVHSSPLSLLRLGWGKTQSPGEIPTKPTFGTKMLGPYFLAIIQIYGIFLLCLWLELFEDQLHVTREDLTSVSALRDYLLSKDRWPEMVTFEEMNIPVPNPSNQIWPNIAIRALYSIKMKEGFIAGAKEILKANSHQQPNFNDREGGE